MEEEILGIFAASSVITRNFKTGDIVLVKDENTVRNLWPMARIVSVRMDDKQECVRSVFCDLEVVTCLMTDVLGNAHVSE